MTPFATTVTHIMSVGSLLLALLTVVLLYVIFSDKKRGSTLASLEKFFVKYSLLFGFLIALASIIGSLIYSNVIGFAACELCLIQRLFLYPQVFLFAVAIKRHRALSHQARSDGIAAYALSLSIPGILVAAYHYYGQMINTGILPCDATGASSCSQRPFVEFGFITIPMMSFIAFAFIITLMTLRIRSLKRS